MLKKLQIKFVVINMTIVTLMLAVIFGLLYGFTKRGLESESISMMKSIAADPFELGRPDDSSGRVRLPFFTLQIGIQGELIASGGGYYDLSDQDFLQDLIEKSLQNARETGVIEEYKLRYCRVRMPRGMVLVFADISSERSTLEHMMRSFVEIGLLAFLLFLGISIGLARWAVQPVARAWKQQKQFVADASHELKTPLTVILTNTELLQREDVSIEEETQLLASISGMAGQMRQLVEEMLILARSEAQNFSGTRKELDFGSLVLDCAISFEGIFAEKGLLLESEAEPDIWVQANEAALRQVVEILLDNAQKYACAGSTVRISLSAREHHKCCLEVFTPGTPFSKEEEKAVFDRFYRLDKARGRKEGFGLGLAIAENLVKQHRGRIWAEGKMDGNSFYVEQILTKK